MCGCHQRWNRWRRRAAARTPACIRRRRSGSRRRSAGRNGVSRRLARTSHSPPGPSTAAHGCVWCPVTLTYVSNRRARRLAGAALAFLVVLFAVVLAVPDFVARAAALPNVLPVAETLAAEALVVVARFAVDFLAVEPVDAVEVAFFAVDRVAAFVVAAFLVVAVLLAAFLGSRKPPRVTLTREFPGQGFEGTRLPYHVRVEVETRWPLRVVVEDPTPLTVVAGEAFKLLVVQDPVFPAHAVLNRAKPFSTFSRKNF